MFTLRVLRMREYATLTAGAVEDELVQRRGQRNERDGNIV